MSSTIEIQDLDPATDFPAISRSMFDSHENPPQSFFHAFFPIFSTSPSSGPEYHASREEAIAEGATRLHSWHTQDPTSHWRKVVDTSTGEVVGASLWNICDEDPFKDGGDMEVSWFPDGGGRRFVEAFLEIYDQPRLKAGRRAQVYLFILYVHPDYRRQGIGSRLLRWGMEKADEMGVEMFLDSTPVGKPLYEKHGFQVVEKNVIAPKTDNPDEAWKEAEAKIGHSEWWLMWRPVKGEWVEGVNIRPWEAKE